MKKIYFFILTLLIIAGAFFVNYTPSEKPAPTLNGYLDCTKCGCKGYQRGPNNYCSRCGHKFSDHRRPGE